MSPIRLEALILEHMERYSVPGLSIAVARHGTLLHATGYGFANLEHRVAADAGTIYQTASVGKQFTAALIMLLVERGILALDAPIANHFETAPASWSGVAARHLLTHTAGISDEGVLALNYRLDYSDAEILSSIAALPLDFPPGTDWSYSNSGYILLGLLVARVTGRFYGDLLQEWIFGPLEMTSAQVISEAAVIPNRAAGYRLDGDFILNQEYVSPSLNRTADGSLYVSVLDMAKWDGVLSAGALLSRESCEAMWTPVQFADGTTRPYGFGWELASTARGRAVQHDGEWQGFSTHFARYLDDGLSIMILSNLADAPVAELARSIADSEV